jgi:hypothetical protein
MIFLALRDCLGGAFGGEGGFSYFKSSMLSSLARLCSDSFKNSSFYLFVNSVYAVLGRPFEYEENKLPLAAIPRLLNLLASLNISFFYAD